MKTIFLVIDDGFIAKNILATDVLPTLVSEKDLQIVIITDTKKVKDYAARFRSENVRVEGVDIRHHGRFERLWLKFLRNLVRTETIDIQMGGGPVSPKKGLLARFIIRTYQLLLNNPLGHALVRALDSILFMRARYTQLFETYQPDLVFAGNILSTADVRMLREAARRGVQTVGMLKGFDNPTSKGLIRFHPNRMIVNTERMKREVSSLHDYPTSSIFVAGVPQYDMYFQPDTTDRAAFFKMFGLDPNKKLILYLEPGLLLAPHGHDVWPLLDRFIEEDLMGKSVQVLMSLHPAYPVDESALGKLRHTLVHRFGVLTSSGVYKSAELTDDELQNLMRLTRYADLVIATASTMNIEASIFDKPIINIAFDGKRERPYDESVRQYYDYTHFKPIVDTGGVFLAHSPEELLRHMHELLENPARGSEGRRKIVADQCVFTDGGSGKRIVECILSCLPI